MKRLIGKAAWLIGIYCFASAAAVIGQTNPGNDANLAREIRSSAAYAEVLLKKTEIQADAESLAVEYTDEFPKLAEARYALESIEKERLRLLSQKAAAVPKLTAALGKLMVRKAEQELELWTLRRSMQEGHPDVKRARRKVEIYESAIKEILG